MASLQEQINTAVFALDPDTIHSLQEIAPAVKRVLFFTPEEERKLTILTLLNTIGPLKENSDRAHMVYVMLEGMIKSPLWQNITPPSGTANPEEKLKLAQASNVFAGVKNKIMEKNYENMRLLAERNVKHIIIHGDSGKPWEYIHLDKERFIGTFWDGMNFIKVDFHDFCHASTVDEAYFECDCGKPKYMFP